MTCEHFQELAPAFALGILDDEERQRCADHLRGDTQHAGCTAALVEARHVATQLALTVPDGEQPSAGVWGAIEARVGRARADRTARLRAARELSAWFIAAAVLGLYLYTGRFDNRRTAVAQEQRPEARQSTALRAAVRLLGQPGTRVLAFDPATGQRGRAALLIGASGPGATSSPTVIVMSEWLASVPGKQLAVWAQPRGGKPERVALLDLGEGEIAAGAVDAGMLTAPTRLLVSIDDLATPAAAPREVVLTVDTAAVANP